MIQSPEQSTSSVIAQVPSSAQHAPLGCGHGFGLHTANSVQTCKQSASRVTVQVPSVAQQDPVGCAHGFGSQVPCSVQTSSHSASTVMAQLPSSAQHAPVGCAQGFGWQAPSAVHVPVHSDSEVTLQEPSTAQHDPSVTATPRPSQVTFPRSSFPVRTMQSIVPTVVGEKRTITSIDSSPSMENAPAPDTTENPTHVSEMFPVTVPEPMLAIVKDRSACSPTTTSPKSKLDLSSCGTVGLAEFSSVHPMSSRPTERRTPRARMTRNMAWSGFVRMKCSGWETSSIGSILYMDRAISRSTSRGLRTPAGDGALGDSTRSVVQGNCPIDGPCRPAWCVRIALTRRKVSRRGAAISSNAAPIEYGFWPADRPPTLTVGQADGGHAQAVVPHSGAIPKGRKGDRDMLKRLSVAVLLLVCACDSLPCARASLPSAFSVPFHGREPLAEHRAGLSELEVTGRSARPSISGSIDETSLDYRPHSAGDVWRDVRVAARNNVSDFVHIYTSPARIDGESALWLGGIVAIGGVLYAFDQDIYDALKRNEFEEPYKWVRDTGEFFEPVGLQGNINKYLLGGVAVGYVTGLEPLTTFSSDILRSFLISAPGKSATNALVGRRGPKIGEGARSFEFGKGRSFPSGHSLAIATVARVITYRVHFWPIQAVAYTMMGTVLLQRVTSSAHWPSDAYFGGLYGWFVTDELLKRRDARGLAVVPVLPTEGRNAGVGVRMQW